MEEGKSWHARLEETRELWRNHMKIWQESGLSQAAYCRQNNLKPRQFINWKKRIVERKATNAPLTFAELPIEKMFARRSPSMPGAIRVEIRPGYLIEIEKGFDPQTLL